MSDKVGIIGGSGLYSLFKNNITFKKVKTPFGNPSSEYAIGEMHNKEVIFLPRHGINHEYLPHEINYKANIYGMKALGVSKIISISAVGSLKDELRPKDVVVVDQFFDRTSKRPQTFFGDGLVAHVAFGDPVCPSLREMIINTLKKMNVRFHKTGTYVNMEGPQFSTRAESNFYRNQGFEIIGMTNLSEARLAREAEICYTSLSFVTDYDCWKEEEENVTTNVILQTLKDNADNARQIISNVLKDITDNTSPCSCQNSLENALVTPLNKIPEKTKESLALILKKYL